MLRRLLVTRRTVPQAPAPCEGPNDPESRTGLPFLEEMTLINLAPDRLRRLVEGAAAVAGQTDLHSVLETTVEIAKEKGAPGGTNSEQTRRESLRELMLARALYRCGDYNGLGRRILVVYRDDLRGHYATHARAVLAENN